MKAFFILFIFALALNGGTASAQSSTVEIASVRVTARVSSISYIDGLLRLELPNGREGLYRVARDIPDFDQIKVGDKVRVTLLERLVVSLDHDNGGLITNKVETVTLAPQGNKPDSIVVETEAIACRITAANPKEHRATLRFNDGVRRSVKVNRQVDLAKIKLGGKVVVRLTQPMALDLDNQ